MRNKPLKSLGVAIALVMLCGLVAHGQKAELIVETGHTENVTSIAFSPDGRILASGSMDNTIKLWDVTSGRELRSLTGHANRVLTGHANRVWSVAFSPGGRTLASGSDDGTINIWDVASGRELGTLDGHANSVVSIAFSPDGRTLASASWDHTIKLWEAASGRELRTLAGHTDPVSSVAFSPDGRTLASGSFDKTIKLWDVASGRELSTLSGHADKVYSVKFSPDGRTLASGSEDGTTRIWDAEGGRELRNLAVSKFLVASVAFSPDGRTLATGSWSLDNPIKLWDLTSGQELRTLAGQTGPGPFVVFSPDGRTLASGFAYGATTGIKLWDVTSGRELRTLAGRSSAVLSVAFSPDGRTLASEGGENTIRLWEVASGHELSAVPGYTDLANAFSRDGRTLASGSRTLVSGGWHNSIKLWDVASGSELRTLIGRTEWIDSVALSPNGRFLASGSHDGTIYLWDAARGRELRTLAGHKNAVSSVAFSRDGQTLASASYDTTTRLWDVASGRELRAIAGNRRWATFVTFSPNGRVLAGGCVDNTIKLWSVASGREMRTLAGHEGNVRSVAFSPDGRTLVSASEDGTVKLWDVASGRELRTLAGHSSFVTSVAFSPNGRLVLSGGFDGSVRVWDTDSGDQLAALYAFGQDEWAVVDPEGRFDTNDLDGGAPLHWLVSDDPLHALPLEIFMRDYYTPRLLSRIMSGETLRPIRSIAEITNRVQPDVAVVSVTASKTHPGRADVVVHAASHTSDKGQASGLEDLRLFRNGQLVGYREGPLQDGEFTFSDIQLPTAANSVTFTAYAFNLERIKSATAQKEYQYTPGPPAKPRAWLVQIGVNHYQAGDCELHGSANDAEQLGQILSERLKARGLDVRPTLLVSTDQVNDATKQKIHDALAQIAASSTPDDAFFLSFSGHGYSNQQGQFYILAADVQGTCDGVDEHMLQTAISADELTEWLRPIDAGEMTFILDSCDSASSVESNDFKPGPMGSRGLGQLAYDKRMRILAASQPNQAARESDKLQHGLLSYALTQQGLIDGQADWNPKDGKIMVSEWLAFAADAVPKFLQSGEVKSTRGAVPIGKPKPAVQSLQIPAVFDFSRQDTFVLQ
jgi:WD40 repeat protein